MAGGGATSALEPVSSAGGPSTRGVVLHVVGARPNYMKAAPVHAALAAAGRLRQAVVHTGQHYDRLLRDIFFDELDLPRPDWILDTGGRTHAEQTGSIMLAFEKLLEEVTPRAVVVYGDVNSTLACALVTAKTGVPLAHVEAGLRSFDRSMPEEINRIVTDALATRCYVHSPEAVANLLREGVSRDAVVFVGNTMIDTLDRQLARAIERRPWEAYGLEPHSYLVVTLHRPNLVDDARRLAEVMTTIESVALGLPVVFPVHPRTRRHLDELGWRASGRVLLPEPLGYVDFLGLEARAAACLTDSGGVQEEAACLGVPCFTLRDTTERPVTLAAGNQLMGLDPGSILTIPDRLTRVRRGWARPEGWDGRAGERVAADLAQWLGEA